MYLILNTAISSTWGFPTPCPDGCAYCQPDNADDDFVGSPGKDGGTADSDSGADRNCYDCRRSECACSMPSDMCSNFPASFLIDYVRVYQTDDGGSLDTTSDSDGKGEEAGEEQGEEERSPNVGAGGEEEAETQPGLGAGSSRSKSKSKHRILRYQHADSLTCSTSTHPSTTYINAHKHIYMRSADSAPLRAVPVGGGDCVR